MIRFLYQKHIFHHTFYSIEVSVWWRGLTRKEQTVVLLSFGGILGTIRGVSNRNRLEIEQTSTHLERTKSALSCSAGLVIDAYCKPTAEQDPRGQTS